MPIQLDYFVDSAEGRAFLGEDATTSEKMLVKNSEEYTSHIQKIYKAGEDFIILTENSIYLASSKIQKRKIQKPIIMPPLVIVPQVVIAVPFFML